jgi:hypothetical protein
VEGADVLGLIAEIGIAVAGFAGVVATLRAPRGTIERRPLNPEESAGFSDVFDLLGVLDDSPFTPNFSLFGGHSDLLDHLASSG